MKKPLYILLAALFTFTACKKEQGCMDTIATNYNADAEEDDNSCMYNLVGGSWLTTSTQEEGTVTATMMGVTVFDSSWTNIETDSLEPYRLKFNSDGTAQSYLSDESIEETLSWTQSGNQLTINDSDTSFTLTVLSVDDKNSSLLMSFSETDNDDGIIMTYSIQQTLNFTRDLNTFNSSNINLRTNQVNWIKNRLISNNKLENNIKINNNTLNK